MIIADIKPCITQFSPFNLYCYNTIPKIVGCYILASINREILYIGQTNNLFRRFQEHLSSPQKTRCTAYGRVIWFYYFGCKEQELDRLERSWLNQYLEHHGDLPVFNKVHAPS